MAGSISSWTCKGKARVLQLERIRTQSVTMTDILSQRHDVLEWWMKIA